jgi:naringenin degradation protein FdeH
MAEGFRRVITGHTADGRSVVVTDDRVGFGALGAADFFKTTAAPASATAGDQLDAGGRSALEPPANGTIFRFFEIPPERPITDTAEAERNAAAAFAAANAGHCRVDTTRHPMMHTTASIDYVVLLRGEVSLLLDEGDELQLRPFDVVVQCATNHYWINRGDEPALLVGVLLDAA